MKLYLNRSQILIRRTAMLVEVERSFLSDEDRRNPEQFPRWFTYTMTEEEAERAAKDARPSESDNASESGRYEPACPRNLAIISRTGSRKPAHHTFGK
jgi:hypothetical protein